MEKKSKKLLKEKLCVHDIELSDEIINTINKKYKNDFVQYYEVILFTNEVPKIKDGKCHPKNIVHAVIRFIDMNGRYIYIQWGNEFCSSLIEDPPTDEYGNIDEKNQIFSYKGESWFGCQIISKNISKKKIPVSEIFIHAKQWKLKFGKGGQYPKNCRGYVDSVISCGLHEQLINWKKYL